MRTALGLLLLIVVGAGTSHGRPPQTSVKEAFEVATIKRNTTVGVETTLDVDPVGRLRTVGAPLFWLIAGAYGDARGALRREQVAGAPNWIQSERYDIVAQAAPEASGTNPSFITMRPFLRSLLEDRFRLRVHWERRELPVYALVLAKQNGELGPGLSPSTVDCAKQPDRCSVRGGPESGIQSGALTSDQLTQLLGLVSGRIVIDRTGLQWPLAVRLEWSREFASDTPSFFTAVQEQLGLKLESARGPVDVLVIDSVERPTPD